MVRHDANSLCSFTNTHTDPTRHINDRIICDDDGQVDAGAIYTTPRSSGSLQLQAQSFMVSVATALPTFLGENFGPRKPRMSASPGQLGGGTPEDEAGEPASSRTVLCLRLHTLSQAVLKALHPFLPTTRVMPISEPLVPPDVVTMVLFESSRLLSIVPAAFGVLVNAWCLWFPPGYSPVYGSPDHHHDSPERTVEAWGRKCLPDRGDYFTAVLWALLTAYQCFQLTTGLLHRWRAYYCPRSTVIRLLALQAICWPATHFTLDILGSLGTNAASVGEGNLTILECGFLRWATARPDVCWAVIGTTTCVSRSIQIWVTSNLFPPPSSSSNTEPASGVSDRVKPGRVSGEESRILNARTWDWGVVMRVCMLPAGCLYFVMTWIAALRREFGGC